MEKRGRPQMMQRDFPAVRLWKSRQILTSHSTRRQA
jgi:hypothetical protein